MTTILSDQSQAIENAINQSLAAAGSALTQPTMLAIFAVALVPPLAFCIYNALKFLAGVLKFLAEDGFVFAVFWDWGSNTRKR